MMESGSFTHVRRRPLGRLCATLLVASVVVLGACSTPAKKPAAQGRIFTAVKDPTVDSMNTPKPPEPQRERTVYEQAGSQQMVRDTAGPAPVIRLGQGKVEVNFRDAPIAEVVKVILGDNLHVPYTIEGEIQGNITLSTSSPVSEDALIALLESLLANHGIVMVRSEDGIYRLGPAEALQSTTPVRVGRAAAGTSGYDTRIVPLQYISVAEAQKVLKPLGAEKNILLADPVRNLLMLAAPAPQMNNIIRTLASFDIDVMKGMSFGIYEIFNTDATALVDRFNELLGGEELSPLAGVVKLVPLEEINNVLVITSRAHYLETARTWIERLDQFTVRDGESASRRLYVYNVNNGEATALASMLTQMFGGTVGTVQQKARKAAGTAGKTALGEKRKAVGEAATPEPVTQMAQGASAHDDDDKNTNVPRVVADENNNTLLVMATPQVWRDIDNALRKLDVMPAQVLVEVSIWEVALNDALEYGVEWYFQHSNSSVNGVGTLDFAPAGVNSVLGGFSYLLSDNGGDWRAVINALDETSQIQVLSSPSVLVLDNQTADITVGDQQPVLSGTSATDGGTVTENIVYKDTGVKLSVTPRVNDSGLVVMDISQEVTDVGSIDAATGQRSFLQRSIKSTVAIQSGDTIILGGLIQSNKTLGSSGVPVLHKLPVVGSLFGTKSDNGRRTELLVTISPRAIVQYNDFAKIGEEFRVKMSAVTEAFGL
jgi:general secretion pathway protein D